MNKSGQIDKLRTGCCPGRLPATLLVVATDTSIGTAVRDPKIDESGRTAFRVLAAISFCHFLNDMLQLAPKQVMAQMQALEQIRLLKTPADQKIIPV